MTSKPDPKAPKANSPLPSLDKTTPFVSVMHRTTARDNYKVFTGDNRDTESVDHATSIAARGGTAFLMQPVRIFTPPKEPIVETAGLNFSPAAGGNFAEAT